MDPEAPMEVTAEVKGIVLQQCVKLAAGVVIGYLARYFAESALQKQFDKVNSK